MDNKDAIFHGISDDWKEILDVKELGDILKKVITKCTTPPTPNIFEFAKLTKLDKIKAVIIGQDPYPKAGDAHGLAFSCLTGIPASLKNIYRCLLTSKLINEMPTTGNLEKWAEQGVLLLNTSLTTLIGKPNAHADIWKDFIINIIQKISETRPIVFMLWGNNAKTLKDCISEKAFILEWSHPSPLAQSRQSFIDCPHFLETNKILSKLGYLPIDWNVEDQKSEIELAFEVGPKTQVVFTDGSCYPNKTCKQARAGYAAVFVLGTMKDIILYGNIDRTKHFANNQRAEGTAMLKILEYLQRHISDWDKVIIVSDSEFWINMFEKFIPGWIRKGIDFEEKKNPDLVKPMWEIYSELTDEYMKTIQFRHMKSHGKDGWGKYDEGTYERFCYENNRYVDQLASYARTELSNNQHIETTVDYEDN